MRTVTTAIVLAAFWGLPMFAVAINQLHPTVGNALGVPYGFLIGFAFGLIAMLVVAIASNWFARLRPYYAWLWISALLTFFLFLVADQGMFSKFP
jgi:hypothetical protein